VLQNRLWRSLDPQANDIVSLNAILISARSNIKFCQSTIEYTQEMGQFQRRILSTSDDPHLGSVSAKLVTPPQTAINLRHYLSGAENIDEDIPTIFFISASSQTPMDDTDRVPILAYPGPGCMPDDPLALVVIFPEGGRPLESAVPEADLLASQGPTTFET
jgi:hypothetical protein